MPFTVSYHPIGWARANIEVRSKMNEKKSENFVSVILVADYVESILVPSVLVD